MMLAAMQWDCCPILCKRIQPLIVVSPLGLIIHNFQSNAREGVHTGLQKSSTHHKRFKASVAHTQHFSGRSDADIYHRRPLKRLLERSLLFLSTASVFMENLIIF
jgi:hypothetical protein